MRPPTIPRGYPHEPKTIGEHIRRRRLDFGLTQRILARRLGVRSETVRLWELGRARPLPGHYRRIVGFLAGDPERPPRTFGDRVRAARRRLGFTQVQLAAELGLAEGTVADLEAGRRRASRRVAAVAAALLGTGIGRGTASE